MATTYININGDIRDEASFTAPQDRTFRGAWQFAGDAVEVDMTSAKAIHKDQLRAERSPKLEELDVEFMRSLEKGEKNPPASARKVALRDVTADARIEAAKTPDELKALTLATLLGE